MRISCAAWLLGALLGLTSACTGRIPPASEATVTSWPTLTLDETADADNAISDDRVVRRGVYRNFEHDLEWTDPSRSWSIYPGGGQAEIVLAIEDHAELYGELMIYVEPSLLEVDGLAWHEGMLTLLTEPEFLMPRRTIALGSVEGLLDRVRSEADGQAMVTQLLTYRYRDEAVAWVVAGVEATALANLERIDAVTEGLRVGVGLEREHVDANRYVDNLAGYAIAPPLGPSATTYEPALGAWSRERRWTVKAGSVVVTVVHWQGDAEALGPALAELATDVQTRAGLLERTPARTEAIELAGAAGHHRIWASNHSRDDLVIVNRDRTLYALHVRSEEPGLLERCLAGFSFVD
jgi:hypothetical protein